MSSSAEEEEEEIVVTFRERAWWRSKFNRVMTKGKTIVVFLILLSLLASSGVLLFGSIKGAILVSRLEKFLTRERLETYDKAAQMTITQGGKLSVAYRKIGNETARYIRGPLTDLTTGFGEQIYKYMGQMSSRLDKFITYGQGKLDHLESKVDPILDGVKDEIVDLQELTEAGTKLINDKNTETTGTIAEFNKALVNFTKATEELTVIMKPEDWVKLRENGLASMIQVTGILTDAHESTTYIKGKIIPKEKVYPKKQPARFLSQVGNVSWTILKNGWVLVKYLPLFGLP